MYLLTIYKNMIPDQAYLITDLTMVYELLKKVYPNEKWMPCTDDLNNGLFYTDTAFSTAISDANEMFEQAFGTSAGIPGSSDSKYNDLINHQVSEKSHKEMMRSKLKLIQGGKQ